MIPVLRSAAIASNAIRFCFGCLFISSCFCSWKKSCFVSVGGEPVTELRFSVFSFFSCLFVCSVSLVFVPSAVSPLGEHDRDSINATAIDHVRKRGVFPFPLFAWLFFSSGDVLLRLCSISSASCVPRSFLARFCFSWPFFPFPFLLVPYHFLAARSHWA